MIKLVRRVTQRASSKAILAKRVDYISDPKHEDHQGKTIYPARNYNCPDQTPKSFIAEVTRLEKDYRKFREGKRGKLTPRIYEEIVYSSVKLANLSDAEREIAEAMIIERLGSSSACRTAWHIDNKTGRADFHLLLSAKTNDYPPRSSIWGQFGTGKACIYSALDLLDEEITQQINAQPDRENRIKSRVEVRREKAIAAKGAKPPLSQEIAQHTHNAVNPNNIAAAITALGHAVIKETQRFVSVIFRGAHKPRRYSLADLLAGIAAEQELIMEQRAPTPTIATPTIATPTIATPTIATPTIATPTTTRKRRIRRRRIRPPQPPSIR